MHTAAVIAAAGSGERLGAGGPKALVEVAGRPLVAWSLDAMRDATSVAVVVVAAPAGAEEELERLCGDVGGFHAIVVRGGETRAESVGHALAEVPAAAELVAVQDAARPLVTGGLVDALVARLTADSAAAGVIAAAPVADTLKRVGEGNLILGTEDREGLWAAQTPQVFRADVLRAVHEDGDLGATDDASLVEAGGGRVAVYPVEGPNLKVTTRADLAVAEALLR
jgi:2-C-methyl-D-erythritol 4-phosphate cytidylyltransferase